MNRRAATAARPKDTRLARPVARATAAAVLLAVVAAPTAAGAVSASTESAPRLAAVVQAPPATDDIAVESGPPVTANEFFPENRDVTDCIGALERPGCGSEQRGGWRQFAVLGVLFAGLLIVFGRVVYAVRRRSSATGTIR